MDRVSYTISRLRAYPVTGDGVMVGRGASCEMCGEVYTRGDWLRKLPCKHKVGIHVYARTFQNYVHVHVHVRTAT